jgi:hypothetical protein
MADDELQESAQALYASTLPEFIAARNERVRALRAAGHEGLARQVAAFKKPSAGADAVNRLIRRDQQLGDDIAELGSRLRAAQAAAPVAAELRALDQERRALVNRARDEARRSDDGATAATLDHVEQTVWAAVVDAQAAAIVLAGVLVRPLSPGGFGEVDTDGASAVPVAAAHGAVRAAPPRRRRATSTSTSVDDRAEARRIAREAERAKKDAEQALGEAQDVHRTAQHAVEKATREADDAVQRRADLEQTRDDLREQLAAVEHALRESAAQITTRSTALRDAEKQRRQAAAEVDRSVERLDRL